MRGRATRHCWSDCSGRLELSEPVPVVVLHEDVADQRCLGDVRRQLGLRAPEVLAGDVRLGGVVLEGLDEDVLVRVVDVAGPLEEQVAGTPANLWPV